MTRLFVAAWPPTEVAERLAGLSRVDEPGVRPVPLENLHITLRFLGDVDTADVIDRLDRCRFPRSAVRVGREVTWLGDRQLVVPVTGAEPLADVVDLVTGGLGEPGRHSFFGHITVARVRHGSSSALHGVPFDAEFPIDEVRLVESRLEASGADYSTIRRFPTV